MNWEGRSAWTKKTSSRPSVDTRWKRVLECTTSMLTSALWFPLRSQPLSNDLRIPSLARLWLKTFPFLGTQKEQAFPPPLYQMNGTRRFMESPSFESNFLKGLFQSEPMCQTFRGNRFHLNSPGCFQTKRGNRWSDVSASE